MARRCVVHSQAACSRLQVSAVCSSALLLAAHVRYSDRQTATIIRCSNICIPRLFVYVVSPLCVNVHCWCLHATCERPSPDATATACTCTQLQVGLLQSWSTLQSASARSTRIWKRKSSRKNLQRHAVPARQQPAWVHDMTRAHAPQQAVAVTKQFKNINITFYAPAA